MCYRKTQADLASSDDSLPHLWHVFTNMATGALHIDRPRHLLHSHLDARSLSEKRVLRLLRNTFDPHLPSNEFFDRVEWFLYPQFSRFLIFPTDSYPPSISLDP